jgi:hypothetical protein
MNLEQIPLVVTDGFGFYEKVVRRVIGLRCLYGQVIKTRRNDCIVKVERRAVLGDRWRLEEALQDSEDSMKLNTSFVERLNLTIRRVRHILAAGRSVMREGRNNLKITWSCFAAIAIRQASPALKFGFAVRTPAMQAGLTRRRLTLRGIFSSRIVFRASKNVLFLFFNSAPSVRVDASRMPLAA